MIGRAILVGVSSVVVSAGLVLAETKLEVKKVHLCCPACVKAVGTALSKVKGVTDKSCDQESGTVKITAEDDKAAQAALNALAAAGFHGDTGVKDLAIKDDSGAKPGKVSSMTLSGAHNCCGACCKAIKEVVKGVKGVESDDTKPKAKKFTIKGDFDAAELIKALNDAGFHAKVEKE
jgi:copper chaperone CopZ